VVDAWRNLQISVEHRKNKLADTSDLYRFFNMVRDLLLWMNDMTRQMNTQERPRYKTTNNYQNIEELQCMKSIILN